MAKKKPADLEQPKKGASSEASATGGAPAIPASLDEALVKAASSSDVASDYSQHPKFAKFNKEGVQKP